MSQTAVELPLYQCHKQVRAAKITGIDHQDSLLALNAIEGWIQVTSEWMQKHNPGIGGYYVQYADGYTSYSPAQAFEENYTPITEDCVRKEKELLESEIKFLAMLLSITPQQTIHINKRKLLPQEINLMRLQLDAMRLYAHILDQRIATF